jgi:uncharacterized cupredoxin-like copper-binding protein
MVAGFLLTACGGQGAGNTEEVKITLTEFGIESSVTNFKAGVPYHFVVTNEGKVNHEIMIMPPVDPGMAMDMGNLDEMALAMIAEDQLPPDATVSFDYTFTEPASAGSLEFACHVAGHYEAGMKQAITVK